MKYIIQYKRSASEELLELPAIYAHKILAAINNLADDPRPRACKKLKGGNHVYRIRIGNYRVVYTISDNILTVVVIKIGHRKHIYKK